MCGSCFWVQYICPVSCSVCLGVCAEMTVSNMSVMTNRRIGEASKSVKVEVGAGTQSDLDVDV